MDAVIMSCVRKNHHDFGYLKTLSVPSHSAIVDGVFWRVPIVDAKGFVREHEYVAGQVKPSADAAKVLRISDSQSNDQYWAVIPDSAVGAPEFEAARASTTLAGSTLATAVIPRAIVETKVIADEAGNFVHFTHTTALVGNEKYVLARVSVDGVALVEHTAGGFDTLAALVTWANANNAAAGTFANPSGTKLTITNASQKNISFEVFKAKFWDSAAAPALTGGNVFNITVTVNGVAHKVKGALTVADTIAIANASSLAAFGKFYSITGNTVARLLSESPLGTVTVAIGQELI